MGVDLVGVDLVGVDFVRVDLMGGHPVMMVRLANLWPDVVSKSCHVSVL